MDIPRQTKNTLHRCNTKRNCHLPFARHDSGFGVRDHEEDKQLIHRAGNWGGFRQEAGNQWSITTVHSANNSSKKRKGEEGKNIRCHDMQAAQLRNDERPQAPDDRHCSKVIAPLNR